MKQLNYGLAIKSYHSFTDIIHLHQENASFDNEPIEVKHLVQVVEGMIQQGTFDKGLFTKIYLLV